MDLIKKRMAMRGQSGFTLVELLVAVAILAILAGVAVFAIGGLTGGASKNACKTERDTFQTAVAAATATGGRPGDSISLGSVTASATTSTTLVAGGATVAVPATGATITGKYYTLTNTAGGGTVTAISATNPSPGDCSTATS